MRSKALLAWLLLGAVSFAATDDLLRFTWAVVYKSGGQDVQAIDYTSRVVHLAAGDRFRIHFQPRSPCFFYVYLRDAQKNLYLLGQSNFDPQGDRQVNRDLSLPEGDNWYHLDDSSGVELFYLIVSEQRLRRLEALTSRALNTVRIPLVMANDRLALQAELYSSIGADLEYPRIVRIANTSHIETMRISEALLGEALRNPAVEVVEPPREMVFNPEGNLQDRHGR